MQIQPQVTFRGLPVSDEIEKACWAEAEKLERYYDRITSCRIVVAEPHRRHKKGNLYAIRIDLTVPGGELVVNREPPEHRADEDVKLALREAFDTARRRLQDFARRQSGSVKEHEPVPEGRVARIDVLEGHGVVEADDGREVYFHHSSVRDGGFEKLAVGSRVRFGEEQGEKGPQATWVRPVGRAANP
jgi:cold shock CspA family protein/ribosome-associated translation inhibitor RaiA